MRYGNWRFADDLGNAANATTGEEVRFTRAERQLLQSLIAARGRVLSREALLDAVSAIGSDVSDRSVDFIVNRLRRKLRDPARSPHYIATHYGQGYAWIAKAPPRRKAHAFDLLRVGPVHGLPGAGPLAELGWHFVQALHARLDALTEPEAMITLEPDPIEESGAEFMLPVSFVSLPGGAIDAALTLRRPGVPGALVARRVAVGDRTGTGNPAALEALAEGLIDAILGERRRRIATDILPQDGPLPVRVVKAVEAVARYASWGQAVEERLRAELAAAPDDPETRLMLAIAIHSKWVVAGPMLLRGKDGREHDVAEIEGLLLPVMADIAANDVHALAAAKLLCFVDRRHERLALDLAETAFRSTMALATAFATLGQLRMWTGHVEEGLELLDRGLELSTAGSHDQAYFLTLRCQALMALERSEEADRAASMICGDNRDGLAFYSLLVPFDGQPSVAALRDAHCRRLGREGARAQLVWMHWLTVRNFAVHAHRQNLIGFAATVLVEMYGTHIVAPEVLPDLPHDLREARFAS